MLAAALNRGTAAVMAPVTHHQWAARAWPPALVTQAALLLLLYLLPGHLHSILSPDTRGQHFDKELGINRHGLS